ncbi:hypothetical protein JKP88DRAFT_264888 [Tribonema minus]|uniref:DUF2723 domain-containing protein n=1 Tax=Tribonema minus TaxID=303371 RepID=A0A836CAE6_9STRA|nr:hypothetical protein JKP88DRAFT_264888 [Tribonema minus]
MKRRRKGSTPRKHADVAAIAARTFNSAETPKQQDFLGADADDGVTVTLCKRHVALFLGILAVYVRSVRPSVPGGDSGELLAEACGLGTAHPPGYPLFTLLHHAVYRAAPLLRRFTPSPPAAAKHCPIVTSGAVVWGANLTRAPPLVLAFPHSHICRFAPSPPAAAEHCPIVTSGAVAWGANLLACAFGAGAAAALALAVEVWTAGTRAHCPGAAAAAAVLFALSPLTWEYSVGTEVFALNNLLLALLLLASARLHRAPSARAAARGALLCGLALSNQHAALLTAVPLALCAAHALRHARLLSAPLLARLAGACALGLTPWGDLRTLHGFLRHVLREEYGTFRLGATLPDAEGAAERIRAYLTDACRQLTPAALPLAALAFAWALSSHEEEEGRHVAERGSRCCTADGSGGGACAAAPAAAAAAAPSSTAESSTDAAQPLRATAAAADGGAGAQRHGARAAAPPPLPPWRAAWAAARAAPAGARDAGAALALAWLTYVVVWHCVLSNLSLAAPMPRGVHARFWLQPNLLLAALAGGGAGVAAGVAGGAWRRCGGGGGGAALLPRGAGLAAAAALSVAVAWRRWPAADRSDAWAVHQRGAALLAALPRGALLLAHQDLDLNAARYLRACESARADVAQVSLQMAPYPWFAATQRASLRARGVEVPLPFAALVSSMALPECLYYHHGPRQRTCPAQARCHRMPTGPDRYVCACASALCVRQANLPTRPDSIFLDMQAMEDTEIGTAGLYQGAYALLPWGPLFRVTRVPPPQQQQRAASAATAAAALSTEPRHGGVLAALQTLRQCSAPLPPHAKYAPGTWEFGAASFYWDAHNQVLIFVALRVSMLRVQAALFLLSYAIEAAHVLGARGAEGFGPYVTALRQADALLSETDPAVGASHALNTGEFALVKNSALALMKLQSALAVALQLGDQLKLPPGVPHVTPAEEAAARARCVALLSRYLLMEETAADAQTPVFIEAFNRLKQALHCPCSVSTGHQCSTLSGQSAPDQTPVRQHITGSTSTSTKES